MRATAGARHVVPLRPMYARSASIALDTPTYRDTIGACVNLRANLVGAEIRREINESEVRHGTSSLRELTLIQERGEHPPSRHH